MLRIILTWEFPWEHLWQVVSGSTAVVQLKKDVDAIQDDQNDKNKSTEPLLVQQFSGFLDHSDSSPVQHLPLCNGRSLAK